MKKKLMLALMLILCAALLAGCAEDGKKFNVLSNNNGASQQEQPSRTTQDEYDPRVEEDGYVADEWTPEALPTQAVVTPTPAPTVRSEYAGATPVVVDPIDKPTPTAVPKLNVTYTAYDAVKLGLSFEGPAGWLIDDTAADTFIIQNPNALMDYMAFLEIRAQKVSGDYSSSDLRSVVNSMLNAIGTSCTEEYNPSQTDTRELLGKTGVYANYNGALSDGTQVAGRVHAVCVDKVLYTIHISTPRAQWNDYKEMVYDKLRDTITLTK